MDRAVGHGLAAAPWALAEKGEEHAHVRRAAGFLAWSQTEPGHLCPISMTLLQGSLLVQHGPDEVADVFCASRLEGHGGAYGMLAGGDQKAVVRRATPTL